MSRLVIARTLNGLGVMSATVGTAVSLLGLLGVIVTTSTSCPESIGSARCNAAGFKAANLAAFGLVGAGCAGGLLMAGKLIDSEA